MKVLATIKKCLILVIIRLSQNATMIQTHGDGAAIEEFV